MKTRQYNVRALTYRKIRQHFANESLPLVINKVSLSRLVSSWDGGVSTVNNTDDESHANRKRQRRDSWDEEYDQGAVCVYLSCCLRVNGPSAFQLCGLSYVLTIPLLNVLRFLPALGLLQF